MIEIKVTTREKAREKCECGADAVLCESMADVQIGGEPEEIKNELIALIKAFEKYPTIAHIWGTALRECILDMKRRNKNEHTSA